MASRIEDYALIGDLGSAALVGRDGSIDWLCWPRFDSDACFASLLGTPEHGRWQIAPKDGAAKITRRYRPNTLILETRFETAEGAVTLIDFMPPREGNSHLLRLVVGERGRVDFHSELDSALRLWRDRALGDAHRRDDDARHCRPRHGGPALADTHARRKSENRWRLHRRRRRKGLFQPVLRLVASGGAEAMRCRSAFERNGKILDRLDQARTKSLAPGTRRWCAR